MQARAVAQRQLAGQVEAGRGVALGHRQHQQIRRLGGGQRDAVGHAARRLRLHAHAIERFLEVAGGAGIVVDDQRAARRDGGPLVPVARPARTS